MFKECKNSVFANLLKAATINCCTPGRSMKRCLQDATIFAQTCKEKDQKLAAL